MEFIMGRFSLSLSLSITMITATLSGCSNFGSDDDDASGFKDPNSTYAGMLITTTKDYTSSTLWFNNFASGDLSSVSQGESGDPWLVDLGGKPYLFNRTADKLNFRAFDANGPIGEQLSTPEAQGGDPHAATLLSADRVLLAHSVAGKLVIMNPATGVGTTVNADFDVGDGPFRPQAFFTRMVGSTREIFVIHQGLNKDYNAGTGKSQVFVLKDDGVDITTEDIDLISPKVQGINLHVTNPSAFIMGADGQVMVVGFCTSYIKDPCKEGADGLDLDARTAAMVYDVASSSYVGNGEPVQGADGSFYAPVIKGSDKVVAQFSAKTESSAVIFTFPSGDNHAGCCSLNFDDSAKTLYVGDYDAKGDGNGVINALTSDAKVTTMSIAGRPYTSLFIGK